MVYIETDSWPQRWCDQCQAMTSTCYWKLLERSDGLWLVHYRCGYAEPIPEGFQLERETES